jgi:hypothetical protein
MDRVKNRAAQGIALTPVRCLMGRPGPKTKKIKRVYIRITFSGKYLRRKFPDTANRWHKLHDRP